ncbi:winged helix-turn-helix domain-containing protein [Paenibacillus albiflavus]|uniref:Winged helix-turn-helix domain-containing protein n=1 Tax=Paenibacillus albiflavus TaxID=2545760 RepID=A0A4R4EJ54_9BACL|nr:crosslink repair DNA glycosylase YcaQ family protein [Paenibacillus albiflavus]TCZ78268.1 winged helix-turn-helix domain-containing protein [Paenibacillus albiflavus]
MKPLFVTKEQLAQYLVAYHHLTDETALEHHQLVDYIRKVGCIQFDPLDVVGKNPDLVLQARCSTYERGDIDAFLYKDRSLFDVWDKNMSICTVDDWPYFARFREKYRSWCEQYSEVIAYITDYLMEHDYACSTDFALEERVSWHYGPQRLAKAALECMCYAGLAIVHHKKGTRRYYGLAERYIPNDLYSSKDPNQTREAYDEWLVQRRMNSVGALWNRPSDAWLGVRDFKSDNRKRAFASLQRDHKIVELQVEGIKHSVYITQENVPLLDQVLSSASKNSGTIRFLAPLDNLLWDRKLIAELFGFDYKWEVYTPQHLRQYGYYVLPILCDAKLIGRIEMGTDRKAKTLTVKSVWWENGIASSDPYQVNLQQAVERLAACNGCTNVIWESK